MRARFALRRNLTAFIGIMVCAWSAALISLVLHGRAGHFAALAVPVAFLAIVALVSIRCGVTAGILGSAVAAIIFAVFLFAPFGSLQIQDRSARANLAWLVLGGLTISYLLGSAPGGDERQN